MFGQAHDLLALDFARALSNREYAKAYSMCSNDLRTKITLDQMKEDFENMIPLDWGEVDPIEIQPMESASDQDVPPFIYVVLGGDCYSEAIIIDSVIEENGKLSIAAFEFGRP